MKIKHSRTIETQLIELIEKLGHETSDKLYDHSVIPHDHQYVWFEDGIDFAKKHPSAPEIYQVWDNNCMYYLIGSEEEILNRLDRIAKSHQMEITDLV